MLADKQLSQDGQMPLLTTTSMTDEDTVRLRQAVMRLARELRKTSAEEGLTPTQSSVLAAVVRHEELPLSKLVEGEGLNPTMLSRVVGHLEQSNLLVRVKSAGDRRAASVRATAQGKKLVQRLRNRRNAELQKRAEQLDVKSLGHLMDALPALETIAGLVEKNE